MLKETVCLEGLKRVVVCEVYENKQLSCSIFRKTPLKHLKECIYEA